MLGVAGRFRVLSLCLTRSCSHRHFYDWRTSSDSIFALSTSINQNKGSPLGVIRVSGPATSNIIKSITKREALRSDESSQINIKKSVIAPRYATLSKILDPTNNDLIDMGLVLWFPNPRSYTGEDACEFHIHGSQAIVKKLMTVLGSFDQVRPAEPGEFTRRAVANRKLDLMQAESLSDLILAQTDTQRKLALQGLTGTTRAKYENWIERLIKILAHLEASIDFGEDELIGEQKVVNDCVQQISILTKEIADFTSVSGRCKDLVESGARVVILGRPNAGKSTFMNILCRQEKSIVSDMSGTTRDLVEHYFELGGHKLMLCDTAGLRDIGSSTGNQHHNVIHTTLRLNHEEIEREGIKRALGAAKDADFIIYLVDGSQIGNNSTLHIVQEMSQALKMIEATRRGLSIHLVINKIDLKQDIMCKIDTDELTSALRSILHETSDVGVTVVSCKTHHNMDRLLKRVSDSLDKLHLRDNETYTQPIEYVNARHLSLLKSTLRHLLGAQVLNISRIDEMAQHVREAVDYLSRIVGTVTNDQVIDIIFRDFCIGK